MLRRHHSPLHRRLFTYNSLPPRAACYILTNHRFPTGVGHDQHDIHFSSIQLLSSATPSPHYGPRVTIDGGFFPYILDKVIAYSEARTLFQWRATSRTLQKRLDPILFRTITVEVQSSQGFDDRQRFISVRVRDAPIFLDPIVHRHLITKYARVVDVIDGEGMKVDLLQAQLAYDLSGRISLSLKYVKRHRRQR